MWGLLNVKFYKRKLTFSLINADNELENISLHTASYCQVPFDYDTEVYYSVLQLQRSWKYTKFI
jgi:hypothetical protein